jgi:hypothetical protein
MQASSAQHDEAQSDTVVASSYGFKSPGHFPRRSSLGFHGDRSHGGTNEATVLLVRTWNGGRMNTDRKQANAKTTMNFPLRAIHRWMRLDTLP